MDHKVWLSRLPAQTSAALTKRHPWQGYLHLAGHLGLLLVLGGGIAAGLPFWWVLLLPYGVALVFLFTLQHECTHKTPFPAVWFNELAGHLVGLVILQPFISFRYFHLAHHRHTNDPEHDPELASPKPDTWPAFALHISGLPIYAANLSQILRDATGPRPAPYLPQAALPRIRREAQVMLLLYALALFFMPMLFWLWVLPLLLGQPFLRLYLLAEHGRCPPVADMFQNTRTTFTTRFIRFIAWNMPYHAEHHIHPTVPFHNLPKLHALVRAHLAVTSPGYAAFAQEYTNGSAQDAAKVRG